MKIIKNKTQCKNRTLTLLRSYVLKLLIINSCQTIRYIPVEKTTETITEIVEVVRDTAIYIPSDQATVRALLACDSAGQILMKQVETLQGKLNAKANIRIKENTIIADCICDSMNIYLQLKDRYQTTNNSTVETKIQMVEKNIKWWQRTLMWCGAFGILSLCLSIIFIISRKINIRP